MADTKISDLSAVGSLLGTDEFVLARAGASKKITAADMGTTFASPYSSSPILMFPQLGYTVVQGTWATSSYADVNQFMQFYWGNVATSAQNDEVTYKVTLVAGTYTFRILYVAGTAMGICTVRIDGSSIGTIDMYTGSTTYNQIGALTGVVVATSGIKTLGLKMATKNGSSSAYRIIFTTMQIERTA